MARAIVLMMDSLGIGASADADQFEAAFAPGKFWFPHMASVNIGRRLKSSSAAQPEDQPADQVDVRIVAAAW